VVLARVVATPSDGASVVRLHRATTCKDAVAWRCVAEGLAFGTWYVQDGETRITYEDP
jgi:hypothetical protein